MIRNSRDDVNTQTIPVIIGTRGSTLARTQTDLVAAALRRHWPDLEVQTKIIKTEGDRKLDVSTIKLSKGAFVKEIEIALLNGEIDLAVHSCKDLPTDSVAGLTLAAFPQRADPRDTLISREGRRLAETETGAIIGTGSSRRKAQLLIQRPDLDVRDIRGNVETRLRKMREGQYDAVVLAAAGLDRMGWLDQATEIFEPDLMLPAPAQGALAIQARANDETTLALLKPLNDPTTHAAVTAERAFLRTLDGGCRVPIAAYAQADGGRLALHGLVAAEDGSEHVRGDLDGAIEEAAEIGEELAQQLLAEGADELLENVPAAARAGW